MTELNAHEKDAWLKRWEPNLDEVMIWKPHNWVMGRKYREIDFKRQRSCGRPENAPMYIHADGTVSPCCFDFNKNIKLGDVKFQTIEEVYRGEPYHKLREAHREGNFNDYICKGCDQTNHNPGVLLYHNNPNREVGQLISNVKKIFKDDLPHFTYKEPEWKESTR
jgi:radical SAM protein with 4Fe4S-binding SPASM domain